MKILVINPGSTSTKIAVYEDEKPLFRQTVRHTPEELAAFPQPMEQFGLRKRCVLQALAKAGIPLAFEAIVARGGLLKPMPGGVYEVNEAMKRDTRRALHNHACNLGALIADELAAALPGVIAASTTLPVIGVPIKGMLDGLDAMLSIIQMPPGIPVATVGVNGAMNAAILAVEMLALADDTVAARLADYKAGLGAKIEKANKELAEVKYEYKTN